MGTMKESPKARMGRPPKSPQDKCSKVVGVKMTPSEHRSLRAEAKRLGLSLASTVMKPWRDLWGSK